MLSHYSKTHYRRRCDKCQDWKPIKGGMMQRVRSVPGVPGARGGGGVNRFICGECRV